MRFFFPGYSTFNFFCVVVPSVVLEARNGFQIVFLFVLFWFVSHFYENLLSTWTRMLPEPSRCESTRDVRLNVSCSREEVPLTSLR